MKTNNPRHISEIIEFPPLSASQIKDQIISHFSSLGFVIWRQGNAPRFNREHQVKKGIADTIGYCVGVPRGKPVALSNRLIYPGALIMVEAKTVKDTISDDQRRMLISLNMAGGYGAVAEDGGNGRIKIYLYDLALDRVYTKKKSKKKFEEL